MNASIKLVQIASEQVDHIHDGIEYSTSIIKNQVFDQDTNIFEDVLITDMPVMTSGIGQYHTNEVDIDIPNKRLTPYLSIDLVGIRALVDFPQEVAKTKAQWIIPSTIASRNFKHQELNGEYWLLWADFDKNPPTLTELASIVESMIDGCDFELYNSRGATLGNQKARLLIPLDKSLAYADWRIAQEILNDKFFSLDIITDRSSERAAQLCYLPNRGELYNSISKRNGILSDVWSLL